jgi:AmiR/NasT family two-component response regulator
MTESRDPSSTEDGHPLSEEAAAELLQLRELTALLQDENRDLRTALESRVVIEQAKGVLAERLKIDVDKAFSLLRGAARSNRIELRELAARVVSSERMPPELTRAIDRLAEDV